MQTIIHPIKAEAPNGEAKPEEEKKGEGKPEAASPATDDPDDKDGENCPPPSGEKAELAALKARVATLEAANKELVESVKSMRAALLTGGGDETRSDHAGEHPAAKAESPLTKAYAMPAGAERTAYVAQNADAILKAAFAARDGAAH